MAFRSRQVSRRNNGAIDNHASARWTSHEIGQIIVLTGRGVERRTDVPQCRSMETVVIDKSGGSINGNDCWQLIRTIKQRRKLSTVSDSKLRGSFDHLGFPTRFLPKPKNRVTRRFFKTEKPVLGQLENRFFGFVFLAN
jgi:hypothetical protein